MTTPEGLLKKDIKAYLDSEKVYWSMVAGGPYARIGDPDMIACVGGKYLAIEAKVDTQQSGWQVMRQTQINRAGGKYIIAKSVDDVRKAVEELRCSHRSSRRGRGVIWTPRCNPTACTRVSGANPVTTEGSPY